MGTRFFSRVNINNDIEALAQDGVFMGKLENISLGGLFIRTKKSISVGDEIEINLPLRSEAKMINLAATLTAIRSEREGAAFTFRDLDHQNFWSLQSFIKSFNYGDAFSRMPY
jgi:Tfp pilus assembly protein PilZ